jgi:hypothetical protein
MIRHLHISTAVACYFKLACIFTAQTVTRDLLLSYTPAARGVCARVQHNITFNQY